VASADFLTFTYGARLQLAVIARGLERRQLQKLEDLTEHGLRLHFEPYGKSSGGSNTSPTFAELEAWAWLQAKK
jgi:hypothetical protein